MEPIWSSMRRAWGVLADYVRADWEDDMEPRAAGDLQPNKDSLYIGCLKIFCRTVCNCM